MEAFSAAHDGERIARLEERMDAMHTLLAEIRQDQKRMTETILRASGGLRVLLLLGSFVGVGGALRGVLSTASSWLSHGSPGGH
jgi:hypothetical protein